MPPDWLNDTDSFHQSGFVDFVIPEGYPGRAIIDSMTTNINKQFQKNEFLNNEYSNTNNYFFKKIEITDPIKKKFLEKINYAGPYFPYCPPCANKNLQFYQKNLLVCNIRH